MWRRIVILLVLGYLCMGRSFAYWGIPPLRLFIGEIVFALFFFAGPVTVEGRWPWVAFKSPALRRFRKLFILLFLFGVFQVLRGIALGHPPLDAVRDLAFNYYPFYFLLGVWMGYEEPDFLEKIVPVLAWVNGIYGAIYVLVLNFFPVYFPGTQESLSPVMVFGQPEYSSAVLLGFMSMEKSWRKSWFVMMLNGFVLICMVIRSQWLGFVIGLGLFFLLTRNLKRTVYGVLAVFVPLLLMYVTNFAIPAPAGRFGTVSVRDMVGRVIAPIDTEAAETFTEDAGINTDTAMFRTVWWVEIWYSVNERPDRAALGYGYGYPLGQLVPYLEDLPVRTPHNAFFFALGYTGWIGVFIFAAFQLELLRLLWKSYKLNGQIFGLLFWFAEAFYSLLTAFFEAPYGAIPFYVVVGCACAPLLLAEKRAPSAEPVPLSPLHGTPLSGRLPGIRG